MIDLLNILLKKKGEINKNRNKFSISEENPL